MQQDAVDEVMSIFREEALELVRRVLATHGLDTRHHPQLTWGEAD